MSCKMNDHWSAVKNGKCDTNLGLIYGPGEKLYSTETSSYKSLLSEPAASDQTNLAWAKLKPIKQASSIHLFAEGKLYSSALCKLVNTSHFSTLKIYKHAPLFTFNLCSSRLIIYYYPRQIWPAFSGYSTGFHTKWIPPTNTHFAKGCSLCHPPTDFELHIFIPKINTHRFLKSKHKASSKVENKLRKHRLSRTNKLQ